MQLLTGFVAPYAKAMLIGHGGHIEGKVAEVKKKKKSDHSYPVSIRATYIVFVPNIRSLAALTFSVLAGIHKLAC